MFAQSIGDLLDLPVYISQVFLQALFDHLE
jgi:hypothetical protein